MKSPRFLIVLIVVAIVMGGGARARGQHDPKAPEAQKEAMNALAMIDGAWRGTAWTILPSGERTELVQTERVGALLGGAIRIIEGRGFDASGNTVFNALGVLSFDPASRNYSMASWAMGRSGTFKLTPTSEGFVWEIPAGPMTVRYTATVRNGEWHEVGERIAAGQEPVRFFEMTLRRIGDTDWPAAGAVPLQ